MAPFSEPFPKNPSPNRLRTLISERRVALRPLGHAPNPCVARACALRPVFLHPVQESAQRGHEANASSGAQSDTRGRSSGAGRHQHKKERKRRTHKIFFGRSPVRGEFPGRAPRGQSFMDCLRNARNVSNLPGFPVGRSGDRGDRQEFYVKKFYVFFFGLYTRTRKRGDSAQAESMQGAFP